MKKTKSKWIVNIGVYIGVATMAFSALCAICGWSTDCLAYLIPSGMGFAGVCVGFYFWKEGRANNRKYAQEYITYLAKEYDTEFAASVANSGMMSNLTSDKMN